MRVLKMWEKDKIQIELTREEFGDFAIAIDESERMSKEEPVKQWMMVYNMDRISLQNKLPVDEASIKKQAERCVLFRKKNRQRKDGLKTCCKIRGADCPNNIRYDSWDWHKLEDIDKWDERVKQHCPSCPNNIDMAKVIEE